MDIQSAQLEGARNKTMSNTTTEEQKQIDAALAILASAGISTTPPKPKGVAGEWNVSDSEMIFVGDGDIVILTMKDEGISDTDKYGNDCVDFRAYVVADDYTAVWRVTSKRILRTLKKNRPITDKTFEISRIGEGFETKYKIVEITNIRQFTGENVDEGIDEGVDQ